MKFTPLLLKLDLWFFLSTFTSLWSIIKYKTSMAVRLLINSFLATFNFGVFGCIILLDIRPDSFNIRYPIIFFSSISITFSMLFFFLDVKLLYNSVRQSLALWRNEIYSVVIKAKTSDFSCQLSHHYGAYSSIKHPWQSDCL